MRRTYRNVKHKLQKLWEDVLKLMAIENDMLGRIEKLEKGVNRINLTLSKIEKVNKVKEQE